MGRIARIVLLLLAVVACLGSSGLAEARDGRFALVIGNSAYRHVVPLANPASDARLMAASLRVIGFTVSEVVDAGVDRMRAEIRAFHARIKSDGGARAAFVFFAGHGIRLGGVNHLVAVDTRPAGPRELALATVSASEITAGLEGSGARLNLVVLDACRTNPFGAALGEAGAGLAEMDAPVDTVISFSTAPGRVAADGPAGGNSPFTANLARLMGEADLPVSELFRRLTRDVYAATKGAQTPWTNSSARREFCFRGKCDGEAPTTPDQLCRQFQNSAPQRALPHCQAAAEADPENGGNWARYGTAAVRVNRLEEAEPALKKAIAIGERLGNDRLVQGPTFELADAYWRQRRVPEASALFTSLLSRCERNGASACVAGVRVSLGQISISRSNFDDAARQCEAGLMLNVAISGETDRRNSLGNAHECLAAVAQHRRDLALWCSHKSKAQGFFQQIGNIERVQQITEQRLRGKCSN